MPYIWLVPGLPLLGFLINALIGHRLDKRFVGWIGAGSVSVAFFVALAGLGQWLQTSPDKPIIERLFEWIRVGKFSAGLALQIDPLSLVMILVITGVGALIHIYSIGYMGHDRDFSRYFAYLNLFTGAMLVLVMADNYLLLFLGWEGVGLCSYLLIGHWFEKKTAADAARKAFIVNRIGDFGFLLGLFLIFSEAQSLNYTAVFQSLANLSPELGTWIGLLLFAGAIGKSAQIPLYVWLPDAMEGPTPVSALIHAATMVTAGVYVIVRSHPIISPEAMTVVAVIGAATALFTATMALVNNDIKRVLAYSTVSQLGYMFLAAGTGFYSAAIFHLTGHAFMKACLFLGAGSVMHALEGEQTDMQKMGGLYKKIRGTAVAFIIGALAMAGIPPLVGFFSKDLILENVFSSGHYFLWIIGVLTALLTAFYMARVVCLTFFGAPRYPKKDEARIHESPPVMRWPVWALAILSIVGLFLGPGILGLPNVLKSFLEGTEPWGIRDIHLAEEPHLVTALLLTLVSVLIAVAGLVIAYMLYLRRRPERQPMPDALKPVYNVLVHKYWVDELYYYLFVLPGRALASFLATAFDLGVLDRLVNGVGRLFDWGSGVLRYLQSGFIRSYAALLMLGVVGVLLYWVFLLR